MKIIHLASRWSSGRTHLNEMLGKEVLKLFNHNEFRPFLTHITSKFYTLILQELLLLDDILYLSHNPGCMQLESDFYISNT